jgi:quercetin dioxygenase-like cupin family protein
MFKRGEVYDNPVTGERVVIRLGTQETGGERLLADIYVRPGGAVAAEHIHPTIDETITILEGRLGVSLGGERFVAEPGRTLHVPRGTAHDWWNAGDEEVHILMEITPGARFEVLLRNLFGLAQDGKTDRKGVPRLLQLALMAREFEDVARLVRPPRLAQKLLFVVLAPLARLRGYRGSYPEYENRAPIHVLSEESPGLMPLAS